MEGRRLLHYVPHSFHWLLQNRYGFVSTRLVLTINYSFVGSSWLYTFCFALWIHKMSDYFSFVLLPFFWMFSASDAFHLVIFPLVWCKYVKRTLNAANNNMEGYLAILPFLYLYRNGFNKYSLPLPPPPITFPF